MPYDLKNEEGGILRVRQHPQPCEILIKFESLVSPLGMWRRPDGSFLVVDVNADPVIRTRIWGAVYEVDPISGKTTLFAHHPDFRDPINCLHFEGGLLVVDPSADPLKLGDDGHRPAYMGGRGHGGIYRVDLETGETSLFAASKEFISPIRMRAVVMR